MQGVALAEAVKKYLGEIKLPIENLMAIGTDGAANMCGQHNSLYSHFKNVVPGLMIFKCICHSIDKCSEHAFVKFPNNVSDLMHETCNWFSHSAKRLSEYTKYYKTMNAHKEPKKLISLSKTRWLVWLPASEVIIDQWYELQGFFSMKGEGTKGDTKAASLAALYKDSCTLLYLVFLKDVLKSVQKVNKAFEHTDADVTKVYSDLRTLLMSLAGRILKPQCMTEVARPGMLRVQEVEWLQGALRKSENWLPTDRIGFGASFLRTANQEKVPADKLNQVRQHCGSYIYTLTTLLLNKLPSSLDAVSALRFLTPRMSLATVGRPTFQQLPTDLAGPSFDLDSLDEQWRELAQVPLAELCEHSDDMALEDIDIVHFWGCVLKCKNSGGEQPFKELALFALKCVSIPISNAVVERVFSVLSILKTRHRNRLQILLLEAMIRVRVHLKVDNLCCTTFEPNDNMLTRFNSKMYWKHHSDDLEDGENVDDPQPPGGSEEVTPNSTTGIGEKRIEIYDEDIESISLIDTVSDDLLHLS